TRQGRRRGAACPGPEAGPGRSTAGGPLAVPHPACAPAASTAARGAAADPVSAAARWAAFGCVLVPVVLVVYGASAGGVFWVAAVLAAVTGLCRLLLRRSERGAAGVDGPAGGHPA
ncbi:hypothetical protein ACFWCP_08625, partial [Streptomyces diastaticus]|uniref:hypothetical protein n=2 Tax=Streptomyces diastaticus TaxID=1956 RepID=UPI0036CC3D7E